MTKTAKYKNPNVVYAVMNRLLYILKKQEVIILLLIVLSVALLILLAPADKQYSEEDVRAMVLEDLENKYPNADYGILYVNKSTDAWYIKAKVTLAYESPCPERIHLVYTYPETKFVPESPKYIIKDCKMPCILGTEGCVILYEEQAVVASHTLQGSELVHSFIMQHPNAKHQVTKQGNYWIVLWYDKDESITVNISETGDIKLI